MVLEDRPIKYKGEVSIFKKKQQLNIALLQTHTAHIQRNKLSDKFTRRDRAFYHLYVKKSNGEDLAKLNEA
jgi:heat shock protein HspQ